MFGGQEGKFITTGASVQMLQTIGLSRTAGAIRTAAVTCLQALLQSNFLLEAHVGKLLPDLQPKVE